MKPVTGMLQRNKFILPGLVLLAGLAVSYVIFVGKPKPRPTEPEATQPPVVQVLAAQPRNLALTVSTQGSVQPRREINIVSQVGGLVERVDEHFADGGFFDAGSELVKVEDADYQVALIRAEARVADAAQVVAQEKGRGKQAAREWRDLGNEESNQLFLRKPQLAGAEAALRAAEADLGEARLNLKRTTISAPFNGRVSEKHVDVGQYITPGTAVARVYDTDVVEVRLPLTDRQVALLDLPLNYQDHSVENTGASVVLRARFADREWAWEGRIVRTDASIDVDSGVIYAVAEVERPFQRNPDTGRPPLAIGLFVTAEVQGRELKDVVTLPRAALRNDGSILLVDGNDRLQQRQVRLLKSNAREAWVQGVAINERVVVSQPALAIAGMAVTVKNVESLAGGLQ
jgi:RND family efflux transporter MFP subunit